MTTAAPPALDQPLYGASFGQAIARFFQKYATFSGRASRSEYWWWVLATAIVYVVVWVVSLSVGAATGELNPEGDVFYLGTAATVGIVILVLWTLATLVPQIAVAVRRLHDANYSGWLVLLRLLPSVGDLVLLVLLIQSPNPAGARFDRR
jgi:uncharacterized membrane protein YhaH (DUF805 family)